MALSTSYLITQCDYDGSRFGCILEEGDEYPQGFWTCPCGHPRSIITEESV